MDKIFNLLSLNILSKALHSIHSQSKNKNFPLKKHNENNEIFFHFLIDLIKKIFILDNRKLRWKHPLQQGLKREICQEKRGTTDLLFKYSLSLHLSLNVRARISKTEKENSL